MTEPVSPQPEPTPPAAQPTPDDPAATAPPPDSAPPADSTAAADPTSGDDGDGGGKVPMWLVIAIVAVVVIVVVVIVGVLVFAGDDDPDVVDVDGALPAQVSSQEADTPVVQMLTDTQWDLDGGVVSTRFGNTCGYQGADSFLACTLIGGDPAARRDIAGADLANRTVPGGASVEPELEVIGDADQVGSSLQGCPSTIRLHGPDDPIGQGPAVCVQTDQERIFAVYLTHVAGDGALSFIAVEVTP